MRKVIIGQLPDQTSTGNGESMKDNDQYHIFENDVGYLNCSGKTSLQQSEPIHEKLRNSKRSVIKEVTTDVVFSAPIKSAAKQIEKHIQKWFPDLYYHSLISLKNKIKRNHTDILRQRYYSLECENEDLEWSGEKIKQFVSCPLVSVIVPNFNHACYLQERLDSIYEQTYQNIEVILLDDCSTDDSRTILTRYAKRYPLITHLEFNTSNSGHVFKQWEKGIRIARGSLIWIAESDDSCDIDFLEKLVPKFEYESLMLAFARSVFIKDGKQIWTQEEYLYELSNFDFNKPFFMSAHSAVNCGFGIINIIPNVSGAVFRNPKVIREEITSLWKELQLCGDWVFYLDLIRGGTIYYTNEVTNYYRIHENSTSLKVQKESKYYKEHELVSMYVNSHYNVKKNIFIQELKNLEQHWQDNHPGNQDISIVHDNYNLMEIESAASSRKPNIVMCGFAMQIGGGETYPIVLANELRKQGLTVTYLNFDMEPYLEEIRERLDPCVPLVNLFSENDLPKVLFQLGSEVVHSHHASVDYMVSVCLQTMNTDNCRQIITMHGMYEAIEPRYCHTVLDQIKNTCKTIIYIADKNYECICDHGFKDQFPVASSNRFLNSRPIIAVQVHIFYTDLISEMINAFN